MARFIKRLIEKITQRGSLHNVPSGWYPGLRDGVTTLHRPPHLDDSAFVEAVEHIRSFKCFGDHQFQGYPVFRLYVVWQLVRASSRIPGDIVEFGTFRGGNAHIIVSSAKSVGDSRTLFLYDTFSGTPNEGLSPGEEHLAGRHTKTSLQFVTEVVGSSGRINFRPGVIPDSLSTDGPEQISFMHVDLNAAKPTQDALEWAFPKWHRGGICVLDDYLCSDFEQQRRVVEPFFRSKSLEILSLPTGQGIIFNI